MFSYFLRESNPKLGEELTILACINSLPSLKLMISYNLIRFTLSCVILILTCSWMRVTSHKGLIIVFIGLDFTFLHDWNAEFKMEIKLCNAWFKRYAPQDFIYLLKAYLADSTLKMRKVNDQIECNLLGEASIHDLNTPKGVSRRVINERHANLQLPHFLNKILVALPIFQKVTAFNVF